MNKPSTSGKLHVINVGEALKNYLKGHSLESFTEPVLETVKFIIDMYPHIQKIKTKHETKHPDLNPDLLVTLQNEQKVKINLFYIKGTSKIQAKNIGAKSFLEKIF